MTTKKNVRVAQLVEFLTDIQAVAGSNPAVDTGRVAQLVEREIVILYVAGSSPAVPPLITEY